ncbi:hypothetical protein I4U23_016394 [Adineta vaga]|nr:hypothetical protein I4U23_016394 [Adineta vaga]
MNSDERTDENQENITIIWYNSITGRNEDIEVKLKQLREINDYVLYYNKIDQCLLRIQSIQNEKIILILSDKEISKLILSIDKCFQINSILIYYFEQNQSKSFSNELSKIIGVHDNFDLLRQSVEEQINLIEKQFETFSTLNQSQKIIKDLSKQSAEFLWFQFFKNILYRLPSNQYGRKQFIDKCRLYYQGNEKTLEEINDFERNYQSDLAIQWYLKKSFIYKLINKALQIKDMIQLFYLRFFITDLSNNLNNQYEKIVESTEKIVNVYKQMKVSFEELNQLKENQGKLISFNGYLLTNRSRNKTLALATKPSKQISVLFEIKCDIEQLNKKILFGDISQFNQHSNEKEVLFDIGNLFYLENIQEDNQIWIIKLIGSNDREKLLHNFIGNNEKNDLIVFGKLIYQMGFHYQSRKYFEQLLIYQKNQEDICSIESCLAHASHYQGDLKRARDLYDQIYDRLMHSNPPKIKESAYILNQIGHILQLQTKYDESKQFYEKSLEIREKYCSIDHPDIAQSLISIGNLLFIRQKYPEALDNFQRALKIQEKSLPNHFTDYVITLNLIGNLLLKQRKSNDALKIFQKALKIQEDNHTNEYPDQIETLNNIATSYEKSNIPRMALKHYKQILTIQQKYLSPQNQDRINTETNIQRVSSLK